ncbi:hypothetical protein C8A05DRAFT_19934, partial [Staphylotrichum tortipilum]
IPHLPYRQNWMTNLLVVLVSLGPVEPSHIGPSYKQRMARLADPSAAAVLGRHVLLTVFLDPEQFEPREGEVVLLMGVKNHLFEGGSVRKYVSDRLSGGGSWWVQGRGLRGVGWCAKEIERLEGWWASQGEGGG